MRLGLLELKSSCDLVALIIYCHLLCCKYLLWCLIIFIRTTISKHHSGLEMRRNVLFSCSCNQLHMLLHFIWMKRMQVLVDAECTHDGSIKHIQKFEFWGWKTLDRRVLDAERTENLLQLQVPLPFRQWYFRSNYVLPPFQTVSIFWLF